MNENQKAAYIMAQAARALAIVAGMYWENQTEMLKGGAPPHRLPDFLKVADEHGLAHNDVLGYFHGR